MVLSLSDLFSLFWVSTLPFLLFTEFFVFWMLIRVSTKWVWSIFDVFSVMPLMGSFGLVKGGFMLPSSLGRRGVCVREMFRVAILRWVSPCLGNFFAGRLDGVFSIINGSANFSGF